MKWEINSERRTVLDTSPYRRTDLVEHTDGSVTFTTQQDVGSILEYTKRKFNDYGDKLSLGKRGEWHHSHTIPHNILEKWDRETGGSGVGFRGAIWKDPVLFAAYLNDPDYKYFRVAPTRI
jgi:hypothetical protein|tara:strand:+ start:1596 stop:1958 length:363 start_codon:yes stop_codon:yes gene_type:complete